MIYYDIHNATRKLSLVYMIYALKDIGMPLLPCQFSFYIINDYIFKAKRMICWVM